MELFCLRHSEWASLYNCSGIDIGAVPLASRQYIPEAIVTIQLCTIYYILYIPCMCSIWKQIRVNDCYKLLFYIGVADMCVLVVIGFLQGWLALNGTVFCSNAVLFYIVGTWTTCFWCAESSSDLVLAFNRCLSILSPKWHDTLFAGRKMNVWLLLCSGYALYGLLCQRPLLYDATSFGWFYNPFQGYRPDVQHLFANPINDGVEALIAVGSPCIYLVFAIALWAKNRAYGGTSVTSAEKATFLQVFLISLLNCLTCSIAVFGHNISISEWMVLVAQFSWFHIHGLPPVIYLALNKSIRADCRHFVLKLCCPAMVSKVNGVTIVVQQNKTHPATTGGMLTR